MKVLAITQIWPNRLEPLSSAFNLQQFKALAAHVDLTVLAAIPSFPGAALTGQPPRAARLSGLPAREVLHGIETVYVRQAYVPKIGVAVAVPLYLASLAPHRALIAGADVILGTWAYPDGCAAILASKLAARPCVVKVHGSDVNLVAEIPSARAVLRHILPRAGAVVAVSRPLAAKLEALGVPPERVHFVENGVDTSLFAPGDKREARRQLGLPADAKVVLFVGRLEPQKGILELREAWPQVLASHPSAVLALVGEGAAFDAPSVVAPGPRPLREVAQWLAACDVFTLPSWSEGTPNVVLEALASGRPVVGSRVGGIPDVVSERCGLLVEARDSDGLARALVDALSRRWDAATVRACGPGSWEESALHLLQVIEKTA
jgi:glycosyltransferase involved in cell wall biosynthesis